MPQIRPNANENGNTMELERVRTGHWSGELVKWVRRLKKYKLPVDVMYIKVTIANDDGLHICKWMRADLRSSPHNKGNLRGEGCVSLHLPW